MKMTSDGFEVYLNRDQCADLSVTYFGPSELTMRADELLRRNYNSYDQEHRDNLTPLGREPIVLARTDDDAPGWFRVRRT